MNIILIALVYLVVGLIVLNLAALIESGMPRFREHWQEVFAKREWKFFLSRRFLLPALLWPLVIVYGAGKLVEKLFEWL